MERPRAALVFRPGFLTREYFAGRRRRYVRPARLFLVASVLLFAALRIVVELRGRGVELDAEFAPPREGRGGRPAKDGNRGKAEPAWIDDERRVQRR